AGTGTVDLAGDVGPIGGIKQKMAGAARDGAAWFLAPVENCDEVAGAVPDGLEVVAVDTVADAVTALEAVTEGRTADLPRCPAAWGSVARRASTRPGAASGDPPTASSESWSRERSTHQDSPLRSTPTAIRTSCRSGCASR